MKRLNSFLALVLVLTSCAVHPARVSMYGFSDFRETPSTGYELILKRVERDENHGRMGFFHFRWEGNEPIRLWGFGVKPDGAFRVRFENFSKMSQGEWREMKVFYCGTGAEQFFLDPETDYVLRVPLWAFREDGEYGVVRINGSDVSLVSEPFRIAEVIAMPE